MSSNKTLHIGGDVSASTVLDKLSISIRSLGECFAYDTAGGTTAIQSEADLVAEIGRRSAARLPLTLELEETNASFDAVTQICRDHGIDYLAEWHPSDDFPGQREVFLPSAGMTQASEFPTIETHVDAKMALDLLDQGRLDDLRTTLLVAAVDRDRLPGIVYAPVITSVPTRP